MFSPEHFIDLLIMGWLSNVPLAIGSIVSISVFCERLWSFRGLEDASRELASKVIEALVRRDLGGAKEVCEQSELPMAGMFHEALGWENIAPEDLDRVFATRRAELASGMKRGVWMIGTVGSLAPFVGLFGTVVGIIRAFGVMSESGETGFQVVSANLSEALIATAAGLGVAIVALSFFNYLQTRIGSLNAVYARSTERLVQALIYIESAPSRAAASGGGEA
ncbi:MAG: MotA/TolQ/ExbB proton channel family protein [Myxococcota bacterium]|jgi:biopolymer transport protein ExbB|nr:MotA/TolQ/ExbB proton channel family protein [Myxococcota bacterium]